MTAIISDDMKNILTIAEGEKLGAMNRVIFDEYVEDYHKMMLGAVGLDSSCHVYSGQILLAKNERANDDYFNGSGNLDIWIEIKAFKPGVEFCVLGAYLTDLWKFNSSDDGYAVLRQNMFIEEYPLKEGGAV